MPSETTLFLRLRECATYTGPLDDDDPDRMFTLSSLSHRDLAAIERDMLAPWRERVAEEEQKRNNLLAGYEEQTQLLGQVSEKAAEWHRKHDALKARADALEEQVASLAAEVIGEAEAAMEDEYEDYDAADRAGETNDDGTRGSSGSHCGDDCDSNPADRGVGCGLVDQSQAVAPSPTDAAADIADDDRNEVEWLTAQVAELRHWREDVDFHMTHIRKFRDSMVPALAKANLRILALEQRLDALRGPEVTRPTPEDLQGDAEWPPEHRDAAILNYLYKTTRGDSWPYLSKASLNVILGAVRNWEHEHSEGVTDEMILAYWEATSNVHSRIHPESPIGLKVRAGLEAVFSAKDRK